MNIAKIQSMFMAVGFITFLVVVGLSIGLTAFSAFLSNAEANNSGAPHAFGIEYRCEHYSCASPE